MKVKVTVTGMLDLDRSDRKLLEKASPGEVMDTMRFQAEDLKAEIGEPAIVKNLKDKIKGLVSKAKGLTTEKSGEA